MHGSEALNKHLADFGVPKKRQHFVSSKRATSPSRAGHVPKIENLAPEAWTPTYRATRSLSDRAPFAHALSGIDEARVEATRTEESGYAR